MDKTFKIVNGDVSDGYHTFDELYEHRYALFLALCHRLPRTSIRWKDDPNMKDGICVYVELSSGQISYHLPEQYWEYFKDCEQLDSNAEVWDGHTSKQVVSRLKRIAR